MQIKNTRSPVWANAEQTMIDCEIEHEVYGWIPFTASPNDVEAHGRELFAQLSVGVIAPYQPPPPPPPPTAEQNAAQAKQKLAATDWVNEPDVYDTSRDPHLTNREEFLDYRAWLRGIVVNPVAGDLDWPEVPTAVWSGV